MVPEGLRDEIKLPTVVQLKQPSAILLRMAGFNGLRVLSFESRRAKEIGQLITNNGGVPMVAPSTREVPAGANEDELKFIRGVLEQRFDVACGRLPNRDEQRLHHDSLHYR